ncbi:hypothetical protein [Streptoalloteichus hindustanus]|nr:hypothetical protein [Streptoalloteichus hindustanus]
MSGGMGGGGHFRIDLARAPQVVKDLEEARNQLQVLRGKINNLAYAGDPGKDEVSVNAKNQLRRLATDSAQGSLATATAAYLKAIDDAVNAMNETIRTHMTAEELNTYHARPYEGPKPWVDPYT